MYGIMFHLLFSSLCFSISTQYLNLCNVDYNDLIKRHSWHSVHFFSAIIITSSPTALNPVTLMNRGFFIFLPRDTIILCLEQTQDTIPSVCVCVCVGGGEKRKQRAESPLAAMVLLPQHESPSMCYHVWEASCLLIGWRMGEGAWSVSVFVYMVNVQLYLP